MNKNKSNHYEKKNTKADSVFYVRFKWIIKKWASKKLYSKTKPITIK